MKKGKISSISIMLLASLFAAGQTATQNYITTNSMLGNGDTIKTTVYYDGLGKPTETIRHDFSPHKSDNVAMVEYLSLIHI